MIAHEAWIDGGVGLRFGGCYDWETAFAGEFPSFVRGGTTFFAVHHGESSFRLKTTARLEWTRTGWGVFRGEEKAVSDGEDGR
jgi:hypothetical protein